MPRDIPNSREYELLYILCSDCHLVSITGLAEICHTLNSPSVVPPNILVRARSSFPPFSCFPRPSPRPSLLLPCHAPAPASYPVLCPLKPTTRMSRVPPISGEHTRARTRHRQSASCALTNFIWTVFHCYLELDAEI